MKKEVFNRLTAYLVSQYGYIVGEAKDLINEILTNNPKYNRLGFDEFKKVLDSGDWENGTKREIEGEEEKMSKKTKETLNTILEGEGEREEVKEVKEVKMQKTIDISRFNETQLKLYNEYMTLRKNGASEKEKRYARRRLRKAGIYLSKL